MVRETEEVRSESNSASSGFTSQDLSSADFHDAEYHSYASRCTSLCAQVVLLLLSITCIFLCTQTILLLPTKSHHVTIFAGWKP